MRRYFIVLLSLFFAQTILAQAFETTLKVGKVNEPVVAIDYNHNYATVDLVLKNKMGEYNGKQKMNDLWQEFTDVTIPEIIKFPLNYLFRLDVVSNNVNKTRVYLIMRSSKEITEDPSNIAINAKTFLNNLNNDLLRINQIQSLKKQEQLLIEEELKLENLKKQQAELEEKIKDLQNAQVRQSRIVASQKKMVDDIKEKLK